MGELGNWTETPIRTDCEGEEGPLPLRNTNGPVYTPVRTGNLAWAVQREDWYPCADAQGLHSTQPSRLRVCAVKTQEGTDGSINYTLKPGWNVISFPYLPDDRSVSSILSSLTFNTDYDQVSYWDAASGSWKHWVNDADFNDFTNFEYGKTYEIYNKTGVDKSFTVSGKSRGNDISHSVVSGDNFISPAVTAATNVTTVLSGLTLGTHYSDVKRFNATSQTWESYASSQFTQFEPGKGYNIVGLTTANFSYGKTENITTFVYDSTGARVKKTAGSTTTIYLGKDYDITGSTSTKYIFLGDRRLATKDSSGTLLFTHEDHISSSNIITDSSGDQAGLLEYDPYGSTVTHTGTADPKHKFTGQESDDSTRLYYYGARYMDPQLGRFVTPDPTVQHPSDPQDLNRYSYARNNPIKYNDPTGLSWFSQLIGIVVGALVTAATGGNFAVGFAAYAGMERATSSWQNGASFTQGLKAGTITFAVAYVGGELLGPLAGKIGGYLGDAVGSRVGSLVGEKIGSYAATAMEGAVGGFLQGGFTSGVETALYGGSLKEIGANTWKGAYTGAMYGSIMAPAGQLIGEIGKSLRTRLSQFLAKIGADETPKGYRYVSKAEAEKILDTGYIPNTKADGVTLKSIHYTDEKFNTGFEAQYNLVLNETPQYRVEFDSRNVKPDYGGLTGNGSAEYTTREPIPAKKVTKI